MKWNLGFPTYLIGDGAYPVLSNGQEIESFALEFHPRALRVVPRSEKEATISIGCDYSVVAEVLWPSEEACLIDFGLLVACSVPGRDLPNEVRTGHFIQGAVYLGIPLSIPLRPERFMPLLKHRWRIGSISANVTPLVESVSSSGLKHRHYDDSRTAYENAKATNTGALDYVLHCKLLD